MNGQPPTRPTVLCIVDGLGERSEEAENVWRKAATPAIDALRSHHPSTLLRASGAAVGLPEGEPGNAQVSFLAIGTGRVPETMLAAVDDCIARRKLGTVPIIAQTLRIASDRKARLHLLGLLSESRVHSSLDHLYALLDLADFHEVPVVLHLILDGRDSPPRSASALLDRLDVRLEGRGVIGTVSGRHYAMSTGQQWDRTYRVFQAIVRDKVLGPEAHRADTAFDALQLAYAAGLDDDFVPPTRIGDYDGLRGDFLCDFSAPKPVWEWTGEEVGLCWHHRPDGLRSLISLLTRRGLPDEVVADVLTDRDKPVLAFDEHCFATLTTVDPTFRLPVAFAEPEPGTALGDVLERAGLRQLRIAEEPKAPQLTDLFDGRSAPPGPRERRVFVPLPLEAERTSERPAARSAEIARRVCAAVREAEADVVIALLSAVDLVAREGDAAGVEQAARAVDRAVSDIADAVRERGGTLVVTSPYGGGEQLRTSEGKRSSQHTSNPVPLVVMDDRYRDHRLAEGTLVDVAPTVLELLGIQVPSEMTGRCLLEPASADAAGSDDGRASSTAPTAASDDEPATGPSPGGDGSQRGRA